MTMILIFVLTYVAASAWDIGHVNTLLDAMVNPGRRTKAATVPPAPRLVVNVPPVSGERAA
jgi:hypothetical protein